MQAYLDNIQAKTGKSVNDFRALADEKGLVKHAAIMEWLKTEFGLGHGHATAMTHQILQRAEDTSSTEENIAKLFAGNKSKWRRSFDTLTEAIAKFGTDTEMAPTSSYISLLRSGKKFAIVQPSTPERFDIGIKLKGIEPSGRLAAAGSWNNMVTHRVQISDPAQVDSEVIAWLKQAYEAA